jgi:hypothetical protein
MRAPLILDAPPRGLMIVEDVTASHDPRNSTGTRAARRRYGAVEFTRDGRTYFGDRLPQHAEKPHRW